MLLFRCGNLSEFCGYIYKIITTFSISELIHTHPHILDTIVIILGFLIVFIVGFLKERNVSIRKFLIDHLFLFRWFVYLFLILTVVILGIYGVEYGEGAAIYAQF